MFGFGKKKQTTAELVAEIHNEFDTSSARLLTEAKQVIKEAETFDFTKGNTLRQLGFTNTAAAVKALEKETQLHIALNKSNALYNSSTKFFKDTVQQLFYKFITPEEVKRILNKYNLVIAPSDEYIGNIPDKNIKDIQRFEAMRYSKYWPVNNNSSAYNDCLLVTELKVNYRGDEAKLKEELKNSNLLFSRSRPLLFATNKRSYNWQYLTQVGINEMYDGNASVKSLDNSYLICAPEKDFKPIKGLKISKMAAPDPVILFPKDGGFLIVTAWGVEASDPLVVNEQMN